MMRWLYIACVNFMLNAAGMLGVTYRDTNVLILLIVFPAITLGCLGLCFLPAGRRGARG
jgi:hypothetical protein